MSFGSEISLGLVLLGLYVVGFFPLWKLSKIAPGSKLLKNWLGLEYAMLVHIALLLSGAAVTLDAFVHAQAG